MRLILAVFLLLTACGPRAEPYKTAPLPESEGYLSAVPAGHTVYDNASLVEVFMNLTRFNEDGSALPHHSRFEGPVTVAMQGPGSELYTGFLAKLLDQINRETGIEIAAGPAPANILVRFVPGEEFLANTTNQCVIIYGQPSWSFFLSTPGAYVDPDPKDGGLLTKVGVMIPDTIEPYKVRQCLVEEIVQALGTSNDLYGLGPTMFNDDQAHYWPTKLDYLMLRVLYDPDLRPGILPTEPRATVSSILARINPEGADAPKLPPVDLQAFSEWRSDVFDLIDSEASGSERLAQARRIADTAARRRPDSAFDCTGKMMLASVAGNEEDEQARAHFDTAIATCTRAHGPDDVRVAEMRLRLAWLDYDEGAYRNAQKAVRALTPVFLAHGRDDDVFAAKILDVAAARSLNDPGWDGALLSTAEAWAAYALGNDHEITENFRD